MQAPNVMQTTVIALLLLFARSVTALNLLGPHRLTNLRGCKLQSTVSCSVGIDLGTTYSLLSIPGSSGVRIIPIDGALVVPSIVSYRLNSTPLVGSAAEQHSILHPSRTFASMKRVIGKTKEEVLKLKDKYFTVKLAAIPGDRSASARYAVGDDRSDGHSVTAEDVAAELLKKLISAAETHLNQAKTDSTICSESNTVKVDRAVITVPAHFTQAQRDATERASKLAGLQKVKLLKEPEAAALAYGLSLQKPQLVLVFDLGGGTLDVSVLEVGNGLVEVIATTGDSYLGGDDFDAVIVGWLLNQWMGQERVTPAVLAQVREDTAAMARLREAAQQAKRELSTQAEVSIEVPQLHAASGLDLKPVLLTRRGFESLSRPLLLRMLQPLREVAVMAGVNLPGESGKVGFTAKDGGEETESLPTEGRNEATGSDAQSRLPSLAALRREQGSGRAAARQRQKMIGSTQKELHRLQRATNGGSSAGASASAGGRGGGSGGGGKLELFPAGCALDTVLLVGGATRMPCVRDAVCVVTGLTPLPHTMVHPDEAVCLGAGTLAGMLDGVIPDMQVVSHWQSAMLRFLQEEKSRGNDILGAKASG